jgi:hypothetical protein
MSEPPDPALRDRLLDGLGAGLAATLLMTGAAFSLRVLGSPLPHELSRALRALRDHPLWLLAAMAAHLSYGGLGGALYFGGAKRVTLGGGALFGMSLWGVAIAVYAPLVGLGFAAGHRPELALLALPAHLLYGLTLAAFAPRGEILQPLFDAPEATA